MGRIRSFSIATALLAGTSPLPLIAGDEPLYDAPPEWVEVAEVDQADIDSGSAILMAQKQARLEDGRVWVYSDIAMRLATPQMLTQMGTLSANWLPDKGDLIIHRVELIRDGETIDLLAGDRRFEVLRREAQLEQRIIDGKLTATMPLSGARIDDVLRLSMSVTQSDQALGQEMQWVDAPLAEPAPLETGMVRVSWPGGEDIRFKLYNGETQPEAVSAGGYRSITLDLPLEKRPEMPGDAPTRYQIPALLQVSSFANYAEVSTVMAPYYQTEGLVAADADLAAEVARIAAASGDPKTRAALATQVVQDRISYLMNGLDGGNYLPQSPAQTWEQRYGDCKAKSLLLLAMLHELGVEAEAVLVNTNMGDAVPEMLPMAGSFDHIIVRAMIDGTEYWLDGTSRATRLANLDEVPRFFHALPVREGGAQLMAMAERPQSTPDRRTWLTLDSRAGVAVPALFELKIEQTGQLAAVFEEIAEQDSDELREDGISAFVSEELGPVQITKSTVSYDDETAVATITASGIMTTPWEAERGIYSLSAPAQAAADFGVDGTRARPQWRDIPMRIAGPYYFESETEVLLPGKGEGFALRNGEGIDTTIAGVHLTSTSELDAGRLSIAQRYRTQMAELPADQIVEARRAAALHQRALPVVRAPADTRRAWDYADDRSALAPLEAAYTTLIEKAEDDDAQPWLNRVQFRMGTFDFEGALADMERAIEIEPSAYALGVRGSIKQALGDREGALADYEAVEDLAADGSSYSSRIELLGRMGRGEEALVLAEEYAAYAEQPYQADQQLATAMGWAGRFDEAVALLENALATRPGDGGILNEICWLSGIWNRIDEARLAQCVAAVEKSNYSPAALDSRALAHYRMGNYEAALADANAALGEYRQMPPSRYLKGLILMAQGETKAGRASIAEAKLMQPAVQEDYAAWGLVPGAR